MNMNGVICHKPEIKVLMWWSLSLYLSLFPSFSLKFCVHYSPPVVICVEYCKYKQIHVHEGKNSTSITCLLVQS